MVIEMGAGAGEGGLRKFSPCFAQAINRLLLRNTFFLKPYLMAHGPYGSPYLGSFSCLFSKLSPSANVASPVSHPAAASQ